MPVNSISCILWNYIFEHFSCYSFSIYSRDYIHFLRLVSFRIEQTTVLYILSSFAVNFSVLYFGFLLQVLVCYKVLASVSQDVAEGWHVVYTFCQHQYMCVVLVLKENKRIFKQTLTFCQYYSFWSEQQELSFFGQLTELNIFLSLKYKHIICLITGNHYQKPSGISNSWSQLIQGGFRSLSHSKNFSVKILLFV